MENVNVLYILQPLVVVLFSIGLIVFWRLRRSFRWMVLLYALVAYAGAIIFKNIVQLLTASTVIEAYGAQSAVFGLYLGLQTVIFEVGGAFLVAWLLVSRGKIFGKDSEAYGVSLAFWENGALLGILPLINLISIYVILSSNTPVAITVYDQLFTSQPALFDQSLGVLPLIGWGILERVSSLLFHFAWGYLCVMAAVFHKKQLLLIALPMGLIDALVPFVTVIGLEAFELLILALGVLSVAIAIFATKNMRQHNNQNIKKTNQPYYSKIE